MWRLIAAASLDNDGGAAMPTTICPKCGDERVERAPDCPRCGARAASCPAENPGTVATVSSGELRQARPSAWLGAALLMGTIGQLLCSFANHEAQLRIKAESAKARAAAPLIAAAPRVTLSARSAVPALDGGRLVSFDTPTAADPSAHPAAAIEDPAVGSGASAERPALEPLDFETRDPGTVAASSP